MVCTATFPPFFFDMNSGEGGGRLVGNLCVGLPEYHQHFAISGITAVSRLLYHKYCTVPVLPRVRKLQPRHSSSKEKSPNDPS